MKNYTFLKEAKFQAFLPSSVQSLSPELTPHPWIIRILILGAGLCSDHSYPLLPPCVASWIQREKDEDWGGQAVDVWSGELGSCWRIYCYNVFSSLSTFLAVLDIFAGVFFFLLPARMKDQELGALRSELSALIYPSVEASTHTSRNR